MRVKVSDPEDERRRRDEHRELPRALLARVSDRERRHDDDCPVDRPPFPRACRGTSASVCSSAARLVLAPRPWTGTCTLRRHLQSNSAERETCATAVPRERSFHAAGTSACSMTLVWAGGCASGDRGQAHTRGHPGSRRHRHHRSVCVPGPRAHRRLRGGHDVRRQGRQPEQAARDVPREQADADARGYEQVAHASRDRAVPATRESRRHGIRKVTGHGPSFPNPITGELGIRAPRAAN